MNVIFVIGGTIGVVLALCLSALFSGAETGFLSLNKMRLRSLSGSRNPAARRLNKFVKDPEGYLASILVGNNVAIVVATSLATFVAITLFGDRGSTVVTIIMTFIIVQFCEIFPKEIFRQYPERLMFALVGVISFFTVVLGPIARLFSAATRVISNVLKIPTHKKKIPFVTREEMTMLIREGEEGGVLEEHERDMIHSIIEFRDTRADEVKVPLTDVVAVDYDATTLDIQELTQKFGFTRFPVYKERVDNIIGVINVYDFLYQNPKKWQQSIRDVHFVPESKSVSALIRELQKKHQKMAVVINEYGSSVGIVTIEDMMEEIVGEIYDETDSSKPQVRKQKDNSFIVDGKAEVEYLNETYHLKIPEGDYETISGYVFEYLEKIPHVNEGIVTRDFTLTITKMDQNRIKEVKIKKNTKT